MARNQPQDELLNHDYDGITEYDNQLPGWWKMLFYATIVFAFGYLLYYHVFGIGDSSRVEYMKEMNPQFAQGGGEGGLFADYHSPFFDNSDNLTPRAKEELRKLADAPFEISLMRAMSKATPEQLAKLKSAFPDIAKAYETGGLPSMGGSSAPEAPAITTPLKDAASLDDGKKVFTINCISCHGNAGQGNIGPNLTDDFWIHGGTMPQVIHTIRKGVLEKGMLQWEKTLTPEQIDHVASYIMVKLQGSNPPNPKPPQGEKFVPPTETAAPADAKTTAGTAAKDAKAPTAPDAKKK
jgi:mono/diheme cytochrome c family protein